MLCLILVFCGFTSGKITSIDGKSYNSNPCYNSCCGNGNGLYSPYYNNNNNVLPYNPYGNNNNALPYYNPYGTNVQTVNPAVSFGSYPGNTMVNGVIMCSGGEPSGGRCELNACPHGHVTFAAVAQLERVLAHVKGAISVALDMSAV
ncbi:hypothetical protein WR25_07038 [Diploscapter pachys]|uniref:Uncharacterized protein n=1 Tax=Diploscapter pachys TaxID=2018661 RepID=A0A2A2JS16_9BILA|nr:hypothetical protein WR25_07038 [Diploscapter pachys]